jgi:DNA-binding transcriptional MocR family regulator
VLLDPEAVVAVEEPGYPPVVELLRSQGLRVVGVPVDNQGIVVEAIPSQVRLVYVTPSHQYPLGMVMTRHRRLELLDWASHAGAAVVEDDYDGEYRERYRLLWESLGQFLPVECRPLPAQAGLHVAIVRPKLPPDRQVWQLLESRGLRVGSLRRTYHFTDPVPGFLVGFGAHHNGLHCLPDFYPGTGASRPR